MDNNGNLYFDYIDSDLELYDYYKNLQYSEYENYLNYRAVALDFIKNKQGIYYAQDYNLKYIILII